MSTTHHVFLVPGFFGFVNLGELLYFAHVRDDLSKIFGIKGFDAEVHSLDTHPTASLRVRTALLAEMIEELDPDGPIHLIGHSSGGLDIRLLATPGASLGTEVDVGALAERIRSVVTISTPHHGTPLASLFNTMFGRQFLRMSSAMTASILRYGHIPVRALLKVGALLMRLDNKLGLNENIGDQLFEQLLGDMSPERRDQVHGFLQDLTIDQALFTQLTEDGADVFNASTADRPGIRYGCVVTRAARPNLRSLIAVGFDPYAQATHAVFMALERIARRARRGLSVLTPEHQQALRRAYGALPDRKDNDGVVPTLSQVHGEIVHAARADHLDSIGHFDAPKHEPPHYDWMASGSRFNRASFDALWTDVADYIAAS